MATMLQTFAEALVGSPLNQWVNSLMWLWPALEIIHFIGLSLLLGALIVFDLRLAGHFRILNPVDTCQLLPWASLGFGLNLITGVLFFCGDPLRYAINIGFQVKMVLVVLAGFNVVLYYWKIHSGLRGWDPQADSPPIAKVIAYASLAIWIGVLLCGRLIPYVGTG